MGQLHKVRISKWDLVSVFFVSLSGRDGIPYCETDYHAQFGIRCDSCNGYISGRVLEVSVCLRQMGECGCCLLFLKEKGECLCAHIQVFECVYIKIGDGGMQLSLFK